MAGITTSTGLISGIPIQDTIDRLMQIAARPRELLISRNQEALTEQSALAKVQALVLGLQFNIQKLTKVATFEKQKATSSNDKLITAAVTGSPVPGSFTFRSVRQAQAQQFLSNAFASNSQPLGAGTFSFRFGGYVNAGVGLDQIQGGAGLQAGSLRITDRSGASAEIDLRYAQSIDDVLQAINSTTSINVRATTDGDRIRLVDNTGLNASNLKVQEVGSGTTAASLGLSGIDVASNSAVGQDIVKLYAGLSLRQLNNGNGLSIRDTLPDLRVTFRDGSAALDLNFTNEQSLGELLNTVNAADPARLRAQIAADGDHLEFIDLTADTGGTFTISSPLAGSVAEDLGVTGAAVAGTITSSRRLSGLKTSLLTSLQGGAGLGTLGSINLTNRAGVTVAVNLANAETLDEVISRINAANNGIRADYNAARNGLQLVDTTGAAASNLIVADGDATNSATKLGLAFNAAATTVNGSGLKLQVVSEATTLASLNGGKGVFRSSILINDSNGAYASLRLLNSDIETIGDVIDAINNLGIGVQARINDAGDGIALVDIAGGSGTLRVREVGSGRAAADLRILGDGTTITAGGSPAHGIDGSTTYSVTLDADDTLNDLVAKINALNVGVSAGVLNIGSGATPYRLSLASQRTGQAGGLLIDTRQAGFSLTETAKAQDALLAVSPTATSTGILVASNTNDFENVLAGVRLSLKAPSDEIVTITLDANTTDIVDSVKKFVDDYNKLRSELDDLTRFDAATQTRGVLFGSSAALRVETDFSNLLSGRIIGAGTIRSLEELGLSLDRQGKLQLNESDLKSALNDNPLQVKEFFTHEDTGVAVRLNALIDELAGTPTQNGRPGGKSLFDARKESLQQRIDTNQARIDLLAIRLENQRELLTRQFNAMETALAKLQTSQSALNQLNQLALSISSSSTNNR